MSLILMQTDNHGVATLTLNAPATRNAISDAPMIDALLNALATAQADHRIKAIVLAAIGPTFSSGGNIKKMGKDGGLNDTLPAQTRLNYKDGIQRLPLAFEALEIPVVAAVGGPAIGAGCDLALMCDLRIAGESASFAESFVKLGIVPGDGGAWLLPRIVGFAKACELALTGDTVDAREAERIGLVTRVVPDLALLGEATGLARRIAGNPRHAVRMTRRLLREAAHLRLDQMLELSAAFQALAHATSDHEEAIAALRAKRSPRFSGK